MKEQTTLRPYKITTTGADMTLELLASKIEKGEIEVPHFQRKNVWSMAQASKLIESFLLGLPVPQVFLYRDPESQNLLVVDGQQRLSAITAFFAGKYKDKNFKLTNLDSEWSGKTFEELSSPDSKRLKNTILRATIFEQVDPKDSTSIFEVFERLNTGGSLLNAQEVRNAVIGGDLNVLIKELNSNREWRSLYGKDKHDDRMRDLELILRLVALSDRYLEYRKPMNGFLNTYMLSHEELSSEEAARIRDDFNDTIHAIYVGVGKNAFRLKKTVNSALADAVYAGVYYRIRSSSYIQHDNHKQLAMAHKQLLSSKEFLDSVEQSTTDNDKVKSRIEFAIRQYMV